MMSEIAGGRSPLSWLFVIVPVVALVAAIAWAALSGDARGRRGAAGFLTRVADALERATSMPAWAAAGTAICSWALVVALTGFVWDVDWHLEFGRDLNLFTVPHVMILVGLVAIGLAAASAVALASAAQAPVRLHWGPLRIPASALAMGLLGAGAVCGFPLDDLWHRTYGIDVTMWSPTHLLMIGGASLAAISLALMLGEAGAWRVWGRGARWRRTAVAGAILLGLSTFQLEFDLGIPQWQALYQPVLVAAAAGLGLVAARAALGPGGALGAAAFFLLVRGGLAGLMGAMGLLMPRFPIYAGAAVAVEAVFALAPRLQVAWLGGTAGAAAGTAGLATEWAWSHVFGLLPWQPGMLPRAWPAALAATAAGVVGIGLGRAIAGRGPALPAAGTAAALAVLVLALAVPFQRQGTPARAELITRQIGPTVLAYNHRDGVLSPRRDLAVELRLDPASTGAGADWFDIIAWQGGGARRIALLPAGPGRYLSAAPVPTGGSWKSMVFLGRGEVLAAAPIALPSDAGYGLPALRPGPDSTVRFVPAQQVLTRESHAGAPLVAFLGTGTLILMVATWVAALAFAAMAAAAHQVTATLRADGVPSAASRRKMVGPA